jgi:hypothetical protein
MFTALAAIPSQDSGNRAEVPLPDEWFAPGRPYNGSQG